MSAAVIVAGAPATLAWRALDQHGDPAEPGATTVEVARSDGTVIVPSGPATPGPDGIRTVTVPGSLTSQLDRLQATWTAGDRVARTYTDIAGGVYMTVDEMVEYEPALSYDHPRLRAARSAVEAMFERIAGVAFVPRFTVEKLDERLVREGCLFVSWPMVRRVAWVRSADGTLLTDLGAVTLSALRPPYVSALDTQKGPITVGYEHGLDGLPADGRSHYAATVRHEIQRPSSSLSPAATQYVESGDEVRVVGSSPDSTGVAHADAWLQSMRVRLRDSYTPRTIKVHTR
jgi:hypothetical protein